MFDYESRQKGYTDMMWMKLIEYNIVCYIHT